VALDAVNAVAPPDSDDVRTWAVWTPHSAHADAVSRSAEAEGLPSPTSWLMDRLATYCEARGQFAAAEPLFLRALAIDERSYGPDQPLVAVRLNNLGLLMQATNRLAEAELHYRRGLRILIEFKRQTGHERPRFRVRLGNYRGCLKAMGKTPEQIERELTELTDPGCSRES